MPALPLESRIAIQQLHRHGANHRVIAKQVGVHLSTVKRWASKDDRTGSVALGRSSGRPRKMPPAACKRAQQLLLSGEEGGARFVAVKIYSEGLTDGKVSASTVVRAVRRWTADHGGRLICLRGRPRKAMTHAMQKKRMAFAARHRHRRWDTVMFTDRCRFYFRFPGFTNLQGQTARNITKAEYRDVLKKTLLKEGRRIFSVQGMHGFVLQQDNDPCHTAAHSETVAWNQLRGTGVVDLLKDWPGNSPDLSPIENVWAWVDAEVAAKGCKTFEEFCSEVDRTFASIPRSMLENLFDSMPNRLERCLNTVGGITGY